jgi:hypothetical protein
MSASTVIESGRSGRGTRPAIIAGRRLRLPRLRRRHLWLIPGLAIAIGANELGQSNGVGLLALLAFGLLPDVPRVLGSRARPMHNLLHHPLPATLAVPVALAGVADGILPIVWLVASLVWFSHIVAGWGVGDVPHPIEAGQHG